MKRSMEETPTLAKAKDIIDKLESDVVSLRFERDHLKDTMDGLSRHPVINEIASERRRQVIAEKHSPVEDDNWTRGQLAVAAACYALRSYQPTELEFMRGGLLSLWPWPINWWKPKSTRRDLVRAAALIVAEIERLDRQSARDDT